MASDSAATGNTRLPARYFCAEYLDSAPATAGLILGALVISSRDQTQFGLWILGILGALLLLRVATPVFRWLTFTYSLSEQDVRVTSGLVTKRTQLARWEAMRTVDIETPWAYRLAGLSRVSLVQGGDDETRIVLPAVDLDTQMRITRLVEESASNASLRMGSDPVSQSDGEPLDSRVLMPQDSRLVYRASISDLLISSLAYGQFVLIGAGATMALFELVDTFGLAGLTVDMLQAAPVILGTAAVVMFVLVGFVGTAIRYGRFEVQISPSGGLILKYGVLAQRERVISTQDVAGVAFRRNVVEKALGRTRLSLITTDSTANLGTNLVLPSLPTPIVSQIVEEFFPQWIALEVPKHQRLRELMRWMLAFGATCTPAAATLAVLVLMWKSNHWLWIAMIVLVVFCLCYGGGRLLCSRMAVDGDGQLVMLETQHLSYRHTILDISFVHLVTTVSFRSRLLLVRAHYYAGMARSLNVMVCQRQVLDALRTSLAATSHTAVKRNLNRRSVRDHWVDDGAPSSPPKD